MAKKMALNELTNEMTTQRAHESSQPSVTIGRNKSFTKTGNIICISTGKKDDLNKVVNGVFLQTLRVVEKGASFSPVRGSLRAENSAADSLVHELIKFFTL
ncbi:hypothetical protein Pfo_009762 [Paulownia fortunei]|nr:hypothetical protein Pfo_009762 [Paulownia fortunei]